MTKKIEAPTLEQVKEWSKNDLKSAIAFLHMIQSNPAILDACVDMIYEHAMAIQETKTPVN